jgi:copper chaperone NosL
MMKRTGSFLLLLSLWVAAPAAAAENAPPAPSAKEKCPVCGMFVAPYPNWVGQIVFKDGKRFYFDGPKDLFAFYFAPGRYGSARTPKPAAVADGNGKPAMMRTDIAEIHVTEYYTLAAIDARKAFYVVGSDVRGPMGKELVPFAKRADADAFLKDHRGQKVLRFDEVTPATLQRPD